MTTIKWPTRLAVLLAAVMLTSACTSPAGPSPIPTPTPTVKPSTGPVFSLYTDQELNTPSAAAIVPIIPALPSAGTLKIESTLAVAAEGGITDMFLTTEPTNPYDRSFFDGCRKAPQDKTKCPSLAEDVTGGNPKSIMYQAKAGDRLRVYVIARDSQMFAGTTTKVWFAPVQ